MRQIQSFNFSWCSVLMTLLGLCSACTKSSDKTNSTFQKGAAPVTPKPGEDARFDYKEATSKFGSFRLYTIKDEALKSVTEKLKTSKLRPLNLESQFGISAYLVEGYEIPRTVLIVPKIVFRSSINGIRPVLQDEGGDLISIQTQFALADGTVDAIASGTGSRMLSSGFKIKDPKALLENLRTTLGGEPNFLNNLQCPDEISISDSSQGTFKVQMLTPLKSCPSNVFLPVKVVFEKNEYEQFRRNFLKTGDLSVVASFGFGTPVTLAYGTFSLSRAEIKNQLKIIFPDGTKWFGLEVVSAGMNSFISNMQKSVEQCIPDEAFIALKDQIVTEYFDSKVQPDCPDGLKICFKTKDISSTIGSLDYSLRREDYLGSRTTYRSEAPLSDTLSDRAPILIKQDSTNVLLPPTGATINNTLRTIQEGDWIEFAIQKLRKSEYNFSDPVVQNISNPVCRSPFKSCLAGQWSCTNPNSEDFNCRQVCSGGWDRVCVRGTCGGCYEWGQKCRSFTQVCDQRKVCSRLTAPALPQMPYRMDAQSPTAPDFTWACTSQTDAKCDPEQWQDQWQRITKYSSPMVGAELKEKAPYLQDQNIIISGLTLSFSNGIQCPLSSFSPEAVTNDRFVFQIKNVDGCKVFSAEDRKPYRGPNLSIVNSISFQGRFKCGEMWEDFSGARIYSCLLPDGTSQKLTSTVDLDNTSQRNGKETGIHIPYYPRTEIEAQLRFVGGYFETEPKELRQ